MKKIIVFTDGASRGNPGQASYGFVIKDENNKIFHAEGKYIGITTNNVAEYTAVLEAFKHIKEELANKLPLPIEVYADSRLVVEQLSGRFKIKSPHLKVLLNQIKDLEMSLGGAFYTHIPREQNIEADRLANLGIDQKTPKY